MAPPTGGTSYHRKTSTEPQVHPIHHGSRGAAHSHSSSINPEGIFQDSIGLTIVKNELDSDYSPPYLSLTTTLERDRIAYSEQRPWYPTPPVPKSWRGCRADS